MNKAHLLSPPLRLDGKASPTSLTSPLSPESSCDSALCGLSSLSNETTCFFLRNGFLTNVLSSSGTITTWVLFLFACFVFCLSQYLFSSLRYLLGCYGFRRFTCLSLSNSISTLKLFPYKKFFIQCVIKWFSFGFGLTK